MAGPSDKTQSSANPAKVNADAIFAAMIVGAVLNVILGAMLPQWVAPSNQFMEPWLSIGFYVFAALAVGLGFYLRAAIRKAQNSANSSVIQRN